MKFGTLNQHHPDFNPKLWAKLDILYRGGFAIQKIVDDLLPAHVNEKDVLHGERKRSAAYINYFGTVVDFFASGLFSKPLALVTKDNAQVDTELYTTFAEDADGKGNDLINLLRGAFTTALVQKRAVVAIDFPRNEAAPLNRKEEEERGSNKPRAFEVVPSTLIDWKYDEDGSFKWAILHRILIERETPEGSRDTVKFQWKIWERGVPAEVIEGGDPLEPVVSWRLFELVKKVQAHPTKIPDDEEIAEVDSGSTSFKRVPLVELTIPDGLWLGNKAGPIAIEHFQRRSTLVSAENKSLMAIPVIKLGPEIGAARAAQPSEAQSNPNRGTDPAEVFRSKGWIKIGAEDDLMFVEPQGHAYEIVDRQLKDLVDELFRVVHQMAQSVSATSTQLGRSGLSKTEDRAATEIIMAAFGKLVRQFVVRIYDLIAGALGNDVFWEAQGLDDFKTFDRSQVVDEATKVGSIEIPSKTFQVDYKTKVAERLMGELTPETREIIRDEIEAGLAEQEKAAKALALVPPPKPPGEPDDEDEDEQDDAAQ